jgi:large subunit ribosomal protein L35Ae
MVIDKNTSKARQSQEKLKPQETVNVLGKVIQFRQGRKTQKPRHFLIEIPGIDSREKAAEFANKKVVWKSTGKESTIISGKISSAHGRNGVVRAIFEKGLPGQAIGTDVEIN